MTAWVFAGLLNLASWGSKIVQVGSKNHQEGNQNRRKSGPRGLLGGPWESQAISWGGLGGLLGPRRLQGDPKGDHFLDRFLD